MGRGPRSGRVSPGAPHVRPQLRRHRPAHCPQRPTVAVPPGHTWLLLCGYAGHPDIEQRRKQSRMAHAPVTTHVVGAVGGVSGTRVTAVAGCTPEPPGGAGFDALTLREATQRARGALGRRPGRQGTSVRFRPCSKARGGLSTRLHAREFRNMPEANRKCFQGVTFSGRKWVQWGLRFFFFYFISFAQF